jgi:hypothetical protein
LSSVIKSTAAPPSVSGLELPAVSVPSFANTGLSGASFSTLVSARTSVSAVTSWPSGVWTADTSTSKRPRGDGGGGALVGARGELVLGLAGDPVAAGHALGGLAHELARGPLCDARPGRQDLLDRHELRQHRQVIRGLRLAQG